MHKVPFEDAILTGDAWSSLKRETPWGQVPVLEVDGKMLAQSRTIMAYVGRVTGLHPEDPFAAAKVDEFCDTVEECVAVCLAASFGKDVRAPAPIEQTLAAASLRPARRLLLGLRCRPDSLPVAQGEDKLAARKRLAAPGSKLHEWLGKVDAALGANPSGFAVGDALTMADLRAFCEFSSMVSGWYDGMPETLLSPYSNIQAHRVKIVMTFSRANELCQMRALF